MGIHNVTYILHERFGKNRTYILAILQEHTQTCTRSHTHTHRHTKIPRYPGLKIPSGYTEIDGVMQALVGQ